MFGVAFRVAETSDADLVLAGTVGVVNAAGPYRDTASALMQACVRAGRHYVDMSNEPDTHKAAWDLDEQAGRNGAGIVAGAGLGTWFAERLIGALAARFEQPTSAVLVTVPSGASSKSPGVAASQNIVLASRPVAVVEGQICRVRRRVLSLPDGMGASVAVTIGTGDVIALARSSGLQNVTVAAGIEVPAGILKLLLPLIATRARWSTRHVTSKRLPSDQGSSPSTGELRVRLAAEVRDANGERVCGRLLSRSGTAVASHAVADTVALLAQGATVGTHTAYQLLGDRPLGADLDPVIEIDR